MAIEFIQSTVWSELLNCCDDDGLTKAFLDTKSIELSIGIPCNINELEQIITKMKELQSAQNNDNEQ